MSVKTDLTTNRTYTTLNFQAYTAPAETYMGDSTAIVLNITTHLQKEYDRGIIGATSTHLTAEDARTLINLLNECLAELDEPTA
jgi:hypothetical protein